EALQAPFLIDNVALEQRVLASDIPGRMLDGLRQSGLVGLAILPGTLRRPLGFSRPLRSAVDFRGAPIGIRASAVTAEIFRSLGAVPIVLRPDDNPSGLDGIEDSFSNIDFGFAVRGATITGNVDFEPRPNVIFINRRAFLSLSAAQ